MPPLSSLPLSPSMSKPQTNLSRPSGSTSVFHGANQPTTHYTSIHHTHDSVTQSSINGNSTAAKHSLYQSDSDDQARQDRSRYAYVRKLIKERQKREALEKAAVSKKEFSIKTGSQFRQQGSTGFHKTLDNHFRAHRSTYGNLSAKQKELIEQTVGTLAKNKHTGSRFSRLDRAKMRKTIATSGQFSKSQTKALGDFINSL